jgi:LmbE family N-acetylglucosaminyl deacetylase
MTRALIIAAHPDDEVLGCGGSIAKLRSQGAAVRVVFLAEGISARYDIADINSPKVQAEIQFRNSCAQKALQFLGVEEGSVFLSERPCCRLDQEPLIDSVKIIERHMNEFEPTVLYVHAAGDPNVDHGVAHKAALAAARPLGTNRGCTLLAYEVLSSTEWNPQKAFQPALFEDVDAFIDQKLAALNFYEGEIHAAPHSRSPEVLRALAVYRGAQAGMRHAEAFEVIRMSNLGFDE